MKRYKVTMTYWARERTEIPLEVAEFSATLEDAQAIYRILCVSASAPSALRVTIAEVE